MKLECDGISASSRRGAREQPQKSLAGEGSVAHRVITSALFPASRLGLAWTRLAPNVMRPSISWMPRGGCESGIGESIRHSGPPFSLLTTPVPRRLSFLHLLLTHMRTVVSLSTASFMFPRLPGVPGLRVGLDLPQRLILRSIEKESEPLPSGLRVPEVVVKSADFGSVAMSDVLVMYAGSYRSWPSDPLAIIPVVPLEPSNDGR